MQISHHPCCLCLQLLYCLWELASVWWQSSLTRNSEWDMWELTRPGSFNRCLIKLFANLWICPSLMGTHKDLATLINAGLWSTLLYRQLLPWMTRHSLKLSLFSYIALGSHHGYSCSLVVFIPFVCQGKKQSIWSFVISVSHQKVVSLLGLHLSPVCKYGKCFYIFILVWGVGKATPISLQFG